MKTVAIIGVCGKSGSGKSTYARKLSRENGALLIDVDKIVHELLEIERVKKSVVKLLKTDTFIENGNINRKALGEILFRDKALMDAYNLAIYAEIEFVLDRMLSAAEGGGVGAIIDWALLPISKYFDMCTERHLIKKSDNDRQKSVLRRDDITEEYFRRRENNSIQYNEKDFDKVIEFEFKSKGFFAGSFDPFTTGHLDIVRQASKDFDSIIVGIAVNSDKMRRFDKDSMQQAILKTAIEYKMKNMECVVYSGLTGDKALEMECYTLVRGLRDDADKLYEQRIASYNKQHFGLDTVYYYSPAHLKDVSSSKIKELMRKNKSIENLVPKAVHDLVR